MDRNSRNEINFDSLAELSKIEFSDQEKLSIEKELNDFLEMLSRVNEAESEITREDKTAMKNVLRRDVADNDEFSSEEMLFNAKTKADGYITVPRVVGE